MKKLMCVALALMVWTGGASANDGAVHNVGGTVRAMAEHPTITLLAEHVRVRVFRRHATVECVFFLRNDGPDTSVTMGFPDYSGGAVDTRTGPHFEFFESYVDGEKVDTEITSSDRAEGTAITHWWTKDVEFAEGETRVVRDLYLSGLGGDADHNLWFTYLLHTGASWAGNIGAASIEVTFVDFGTEQLANVEPEPSGQDEGGVWWSFCDVEPGMDGAPKEISVRWRYNAITGIESDFHRAAASGDMEAVRTVLNEKITVDDPGDFDRTALRLAVDFNAGPEMVRFLIDSGADPNLYNRGWDTPLHSAARNADGDADVVTQLLTGGALVDAPVGNNVNGKTALMLSMDLAPLDVVAALIDGGADVNGVGAGGNAVIHEACRYSYREHVLGKIELLLENGEDPNAVNNDGKTPGFFVKDFPAALALLVR